MTTLTDFAPDDLAILNRTPTAVAMAAAYAEQDGPISLVKEMRAGLTAAREAAFAFPDNEVIQLLAAAMQEVEDEENGSETEGRQGGEAGEEEPNDVVEERNPQRSQESSLELAAQSLAIMEQNATLEEAVQFKHWLLAIADQVTLATKSGGFLGFGGTQVAEGEQAYLASLREALAIEG